MRKNWIYLLPIVTVLIFVGGFIHYHSSQLGSDTIDILSPRLDFAAGKKLFIPVAVAASDEEILNHTTIYNDQHMAVPLPISIEKTSGTSSIVISPSDTMKPGKYTLQTTIQGRLHAQDFTWGVLALNTDKSLYKPGETAHISLAVLNETGSMTCDASLFLTIVNPQGQKTTLKTDDQSIVVNPECQIKNITQKPDFETSYKTKSTGRYEMVLTAKTRNGTYTIRDSFSVDTDVPFSLTRTSATRIFPQEKYPMTLTITTTQDFKGTIVEHVPHSFAISQVPGLPTFTVNEEPDRTLRISWDISLKKDDRVTLGYLYDAPNISPQFYLLGPIQFISLQGNILFSELRQWQIAADAIAVSGSAVTGSTTNAASFSLSSWTIQPNELILLAVAVRDETKTVTASSTSLGSFSQISDLDNSQAQGGITLFCAISSSTATEQISVSISGNTLPAVAVASRFTGADLNGPCDTTTVEAIATNAGPPVTDDANAKINISTLSSNSWAFAAAWHRTTTFTANPPGGAGETTISLNNTVGAAGDQTQVSTWYETTTSPGSVTLGADGDMSGSNDWAIIAISIKPPSESGYFLLMD